LYNHNREYATERRIPIRTIMQPSTLERMKPYISDCSRSAFIEEAIWEKIGTLETSEKEETP
jgi:hypothetical protein